MSEANTIHHTFVIERHYPHSPDQVFKAFADPALKRRWFAEGHSHELEMFEMDFRVGGMERTRSRFNQSSPFPGVALHSEGIYHDIVPNRRIIVACTMAMEERRFSVSLVTFELIPAAKGTDLICTHQGAFLEGADGPELREQGWRKLLESLAAELRVARACMSREGTEIDRIFHALGDPTRRAIIERLSEGPVSVSGLAPPLGITVTAVGQHLQVLEASGLVRTEKSGRVRTCRIEPGGLAILQRWIDDRRSIWERRLGRLGQLLDE